MKDFYTRRDIMNTLGISREIIEGYEIAELIQPTKKDDVGAKLYDRDTVIKLGFICLCRKIGFNIDQIRKLLIMPENEVKSIMFGKFSQSRDEIEKHELVSSISASLSFLEAGDPRKSKQLLNFFDKKHQYYHKLFEEDGLSSLL